MAKEQFVTCEWCGERFPEKDYKTHERIQALCRAKPKPEKQVRQRVSEVSKRK